MDFGTEMVRVIVGANKKAFTFHKNLIRRHSEYFSRAFGPNFKEGEEDALYLAEVDEASCRIFQAWLYMQTARSMHHTVTAVENALPKSTTVAKWNPDLSDEVHSDLTTHLINLYIFADAHECTVLRNDVMSAIVSFTNRSTFYAGFEKIPRVLSRLPLSSTLCQYLLKLNAEFFDGESHEIEQLEALPHSFLCQLVVLTAQLKHRWSSLKESLAELEDCCNFHEHIDEKEKQICRSRRMKDQPFIDVLLSVCMEDVQATQVSKIVDASG